MKLNAYSLHDVKALNYSPPFFAQSDAVAKRMISELAADLNTVVGRHPADFRLYFVGLFDDQTGVIEPVLATHIADVISLLPARSTELPFAPTASEPTLAEAFEEARNP